jgi:AraC-type DNA-binding domain-containing proteins
MPPRPPERRAAPRIAATPMAFARAVAAAYRRHGQDPAEALRAAQITPARLQQPDGRITAHQMEVLSEAAMQELDDEALGAFSRRLPWGSYGMLARASISSPDLRVALKRWCRHHALLTDDIRLELVETGAGAAIVVEERGPLGSKESGLREFCLMHVLRNVHGLACWFIDSRIALQSARFPYPAPPHADALGLIFQCPIAFNAPRAEIHFNAHYLALPLRREEKALRQMLQRALPLTVRQYRRDRLLVQQVRQALAAHPGRTHSAEGLAALLHISSRTLHRQLKQEGASLQQLKDEVRCERAKDLLFRGRKPIKQVAAAVGFRNEKSFARAFHDWTGEWPGAYRESEGVRQSSSTATE